MRDYWEYVLSSSDWEGWDWEIQAMKRHKQVLHKHTTDSSARPRATKSIFLSASSSLLSPRAPLCCIFHLWQLTSFHKEINEDLCKHLLTGAGQLTTCASVPSIAFCLKQFPYLGRGNGHRKGSSFIQHLFSGWWLFSALWLRQRTNRTKCKRERKKKALWWYEVKNWSQI